MYNNKHSPIGHLFLRRQGAGVRESRNLGHPEVARPDDVHALAGLEVRPPYVAEHRHLAVARRVLQHLRT